MSATTHEGDAGAVETTELAIERLELHDFSDGLWKPVRRVDGPAGEALELVARLNESERLGFESIPEDVRRADLTQLAEWRLVEVRTVATKRVLG
jgi:hypothetical protein